ncbi:hypothetical protein J6590_076757 [Homalodisca vitripennis]|nr:hypothetical protein J6590_076757 [Homalodisca vitripennis]
MGPRSAFLSNPRLRSTLSREAPYCGLIPFFQLRGRESNRAEEKNLQRELGATKVRSHHLNEVPRTRGSKEEGSALRWREP